MESNCINIQIKHLGKATTLNVYQDISIIELKEMCKEISNIEPDEQILIYNGNVMKNEDTISMYGIQNDSIINLVKASKKPNKQENTVHYPMATSGISRMNPLGMPTVPSNPNPTDSFSNMMKNPLVKQMTQQIMSNPEVMKSMMENNPMLKEMAEQYPEIEGLISNPDSLHSMLDPGMVDASMELMEKLSHIRSSTTMSGTPGSFPMPGGPNPVPSSQLKNPTNTLQNDPFNNYFLNLFNQPTNNNTQGNTQQNPFNNYFLNIFNQNNFNTIPNTTNLSNSTNPQNQYNPCIINSHEPFCISKYSTESKYSK